MINLTLFYTRFISEYLNPKRQQGDDSKCIAILQELFNAGKVEQARVDREAVIGAEIPDIFKYACSVYLSALAAVAPKGEA